MLSGVHLTVVRDEDHQTITAAGQQHAVGVHWLDEARSKPGSPWAVCSWFAEDEYSVAPLARAREKYPHHVPCDSCFSGRVLPDEDSATGQA